MADKLQTRVISGAFWQAPAIQQTSIEQCDCIVHAAQQQGLDMLLLPGASLNSFESALKKYAKTRKRFYFDGSVEGLSLGIFSLTISILIAVVLGVVSLYEELFVNFVEKGTLDGVAQFGWFFFSALLIVLLANYLPKLLTGEGSWFREQVISWQNHDHRVRHRLKRQMRFVERGEAADKHIRIWNACHFPLDSWVWKSFVPALLELRCPLDFYVRSKKGQTLLAELEARTSQFRPVDSTVVLIKAEKKASSSDNLSTVLALLDNNDRILLELAGYISTLNLPESWQLRLHVGNDLLSGAISHELFDFVLRKGANYLLTDNPEPVEHLLSSFLHRAQFDYRLLETAYSGEQRILHLKKELNSFFDFDLFQEQAQFHFIDSQIKAELTSYCSQSNDPLAILIALGLGGKEPAGRICQVPIVERLIQTVRDKEMYFLVDLLDVLLTFSRPADNNGPSNKYKGFSVPALDALLDLYERSGKYENALTLVRYVSQINPVIYSMREARILERLGKYSEACAVLKEIARQHFTENVLADPHFAEILVRYNLHLSWTIVSGRLAAEKEIGKTALATAAELYASMLGEKLDPYLLWRYHNNSANYAEWEDDIDRCVQQHLCCLDVPGVELKWISGTHVNLGIAYRFLFKKNKDRTALQKALLHSSEGVKIKRDIGDHDELPITLHNSALTRLEMAMLLPDVATEGDIQAALTMAGEGLTLLRQSQSKKKEGLLLAERHIAAQMLEAKKCLPDTISESCYHELLDWQENIGVEEAEDRIQVEQLLSCWEACKADMPR